jgi:transposase-like protein
MSSITYSEVVKDSGNPFNLRLKIVRYALEQGIKSTAREFSCSRNTVRKWLRRYQKDGLNGLTNKSRKPLHSPNKIPLQEEQYIVDLRNRLVKISPLRMKYEFGVDRAVTTIYRIIKQKCKPATRWKKHNKKNDLRQQKAKLRVFENIQIDIKDLCDIPNYWQYMKLLKLPRYQFTARDVRSGALFYAYGRSKEAVNASTFSAYLLAHLKRHGIDISKVGVQTDNDGAFVGNWRPDSSSPFKYIVEEIYKAVHNRIPPSAPTYNSDVETSHARIEEEFYDIEEMTSERNLLNKALAYQIYFNLARPNRYRNMKSPLKIIEELLGPIDPYLLVLPPIVLDDHFELYESTVKSRPGGHHLPESLKILSR